MLWNYTPKALSIYKKAFDENHPKGAACMANVGSAYSGNHKYLEALVLYQKVFDYLRKNIVLCIILIWVAHTRILLLFIDVFTNTI